MKRLALLTIILILFNGYTTAQDEYTYKIVDTSVEDFYSHSSIIAEPAQGQPYYGQDAHYSGYQPSYTDNGDGTVTDNITGLIWQQDMGEKMTWAEGFVAAEECTLGGYTDWRFPTIKELYSLIRFTGMMDNPDDPSGWVLYIDDNYFAQPLGDTDAGERLIDAQTWSSTEYTGYTMNNDETIFGVNFVDGRIKGYPKYNPQQPGTEQVMYVRLVRGNEGYGINSFVDNGDGTVSDLATGLMWQKGDSGQGMDWQDAMAYCEDLELAGYDDWRLPNVKELQSIVDYTRSPQHTGTAAIDRVFEISGINYPDSSSGHYPFFWSGSTHLDGMNPYAHACYVTFGEALGQMNGQVIDVHGAGAQRSDPKTGDPEDYPQYFGPQGDIRYVFNYVRAVRPIDSGTSIKGENKAEGKESLSLSNSPNPFNPVTTINYTLDTPGNINLEIYNLKGRKVATLAGGYRDAGYYSQVWDAAGHSGGIYFCRLKTPTKTEARRIVLVK